MRVFQSALFLSLPALFLWAEPRAKVVKTLSPVVLCYAVGILLANQPWLKTDDALSLGAGQVAIAFAIPLLLFSADLLGWLRLARTTVISFAFCILSVVSVSSLAHFLFNDRVEDSWKISAMLTGVYTGGTVNMAAIATALKVPSETFLLVNASDILVTTFYLLFLVTIAGRLFGKILRPFPPPIQGAEAAGHPTQTIRPRHVFIALALAAGVVVGGWGVGQIAPPSVREPILLLGISTLGVAASLSPRIRRLPGTSLMGNYALLVFCVSIGSTADLKLIFSSSPTLVLYTAFVVAGSVLLHVALCMPARIDRDTMIITSTAGIFGPAFIPPVAAALGNREIVLSGIATGLVGYAVANYLGLGLAWVLQ